MSIGIVATKYPIGLLFAHVEVFLLRLRHSSPSQSVSYKLVRKEAAQQKCVLSKIFKFTTSRKPGQASIGLLPFPP
jgi:hypothetical protein